MIGKVLIRVTEDNMGNILLSPVREKDRQWIAESNHYDQSCEVYLQTDYDRQSFVESYPRARYRVAYNGFAVDQYRVGRLYYAINSGVKFFIDSWEYTRMVGGQIG
jgi:hypothetical protein